MLLWNPQIKKQSINQSKTGIIAEASINGIKNIKSAVWVYLCLAWKMGQSKDII